MKLNVNVLLVMALMGAAGAMGCKSNDAGVKDTGHNAAASQEDSKTATPEDNPDTAPATEGATVNGVAPGVERDARFYTYWVNRAPPAVRVEERGVAPGPGHWWRPGYYGWTGGDYTWYGGRWYAPRAGYNYVYPRWHHVGGRWGYYPGHWHRI
jgi:hypothetical protein